MLNEQIACRRRGRLCTICKQLAIIAKHCANLTQTINQVSFVVELSVLSCCPWIAFDDQFEPKFAMVLTNDDPILATAFGWCNCRR